ncbi:B3 domain-containing transcription factor VRN1-like isoform X1 [Arachis stenosperma]|uniref:B3 domain-containing transcription factor VRN1-like isoform X1 n=1 Tax=Arachis stenosperma TaxID=217475 RepID=UPI0025ACE909|nr:B3 domain-containing transcription factor VRN1-like isoform X1 [Arachis stenosperma]
MAPSNYQQNKHSSSSSTVIRFFKIIVRESLQDENFMLPKKFTRKYGSGLSNPLYLKPPDGTEWRVNWTNRNGRTLFKRGWKEFVAYYSLDHGHVLWFEYNIGTSHIEVEIFDMSCLEIEYPANDQIKKHPPQHRGQPVKRPKEQQTRDVDNSPNTQNMRLNEGRQKKRLNEPLSGGVRGQPRKKLRAPVSSASKGRQLENDAQIRKGIKSEKKNHKMTVSVNQDSNGKSNRRRKDSESSVRPYPAKPESLKEANKFKWEKPSFIIKIKQLSQTKAPCYFSTKFFRKYFENNPQNANIRFGKKLFPVKLIYRPSSCNAFISAGWNFFARASKLQAGDVCLFKLVNRKDPVLDVHICRRQPRESLSKPVTRGIQLLKEVKELNSQNPSFMVKIKDGDPRRSRPNLSAIFYRKYFKKNQQNVKLQFGKEMWPVTIIYNPSSRNTFISAGWSSFARASKLETGDVCVFELINEKDLFNVHICRVQC